MNWSVAPCCRAHLSLRESKVDARGKEVKLYFPSLLPAAPSRRHRIEESRNDARMSSRDIREILSLPPTPLASSSNSLLSAPAARSRAPRQQVKRPAGISRELFSLLGDNSSTLALSTASLAVQQPQFKQRKEQKKRVQGKQVHWRKTGFKVASRISAGTDEGARGKLVLRHWVKDLPPDYLDGTPDDKFDKFNTSSTPLLFDYTDEEYTTTLLGSSPPSLVPSQPAHLVRCRSTLDSRRYGPIIPAGEIVRSQIHRHGRPLGINQREISRSTQGSLLRRL